MLTRGGVKLMDFGIAKRRDSERQGRATIGPDATATAFATLSGSLVGTVPYMAPEQLEGGPIDGRTDIFAFGAVLFELATGTPAFSGSSPASYVAAILAEARPRPSQSRPELPRSVDRIISVCLARDPDSRWQDATDLLRELRWAKDDLFDVDSAKVASPGKKWLVHAYWGAAVVALVAALAYVWATGRDPSPPPNPQPVIVLMDSPLPGRVYDPQTREEGGTNADDITDALRALPVAIRKENTSAVWHREEQVRLENPDLVISHISCFLDERVSGDQPDHRTPGGPGGVPPDVVFRVSGGRKSANPLHRLFPTDISTQRRSRCMVGEHGGQSPHSPRTIAPIDCSWWARRRVVSTAGDAGIDSHSSH